MAKHPSAPAIKEKHSRGHVVVKANGDVFVTVDGVVTRIAAQASIEATLLEIRKLIDKDGEVAQGS